MLVSVKRMEDSLKRLKRGKSGATSSAGSGMSDDDKIRTQIRLDLQHLASQVTELTNHRRQEDGAC